MRESNSRSSLETRKVDRRELRKDWKGGDETRRAVYVYTRHRQKSKPAKIGVKAISSSWQKS